MSPSPSPSRTRRQLAAELSQLRTMSGFTVRELARRLELTNHARLSRIQSGISLPDKALVDAWLGWTGADDVTRARVLELLRLAHAETVRWSEALAESGTTHLQDIAAAREQAATLIDSYEQAFVPGLAQTGEYARALLDRFDLGHDLAAAVNGRMLRQELLYGVGREFRFVLTQRAFAWNPDPNGSVSMVAQEQKLRDLDRLPAVAVRVLADAAAPLGGMSSFNIYAGADPHVAIELENEELRLTDPHSVQRYRARFEELFVAATPVSELR